jgi:MscS family membrane protein
MQQSTEKFFQIVASVWNSAILGIGIGPLVSAVAVFAVFVLARGLFTRFVIGALKRLTKRTESGFDDELTEALALPLRFVFVVVGLYVASQITEFPAEVDVFLLRLVRSLIAATIFWTFYRCVRPLSFVFDKVTNMFGADELGESLREFFLKILKFVIACLGVASFLEEWQFNVAAVLGSLGLLGMALAFGAQNLIANLFAGVSIFLDHIFEKGNWIKGGGVEGTVEEIGFRTTKIRCFDKSLVTVPNSVLTGGAVTNFSRMTHRRIYWKIGVTYNSSEDQLRQIVGQIRDYINTSGDFETDPAKATTLINVDSFNASSIDIMIYCFTTTTNWGEWMEIKERFAYRRLLSLRPRSIWKLGRLGRRTSFRSRPR